MKARLLSGATAILIIAGLVGCAGPSRRLEQRLDAYREAYVSKDYEAIASMTLPSLVEIVGGTEKFVEVIHTATGAVEEMGFMPELIEYSKPGPIISDNDAYVSVIPTSIPVFMNDKTGVIKSSTIAFSEDKGVHWFFIDGSDTAIGLIAKVAPNIPAKITILTPTIILGSGDDEEVLIRRDGEWTKQENPIR